jgi:3-methylfumaryl-CoA hydratase
MIESKLDPWPVQALEATLGLPTSKLEFPVHLPPLWHWLYFLPTATRTKIGPDGHMMNQEWVDSSLRRRRLFAAARTEFLRPLKIGEPAQMAERVLTRRDKEGRSGRFQLVTAEYRYFQNGVLCVREERDIAYLQGPARALPAPKDEFAVRTRSDDSWSFSLTPDPVMLMRFSALTFNAHLIHFDQLYTQREEGYPERVVHGLLVAVILARLLARNHVDHLERFEFRARSPLYVNQPIQFIGKPGDGRVDLRAIGLSGMLAMEATAWLKADSGAAAATEPGGHHGAGL